MFGYKKGVVFYMTEEQESIRSIVIEFLMMVFIFLIVFLTIDIFPFLGMLILTLVCIVLLFKVWKAWKRIKDLRRN